MNDEYKTFRCDKCLNHKKLSLYSHNDGKRKVCTFCAGRIKEAEDRIAKSFNMS